MSTPGSSKSKLRSKIFLILGNDFFSEFTVKISEKITLPTVLGSIPLPESLPFCQEYVSKCRSQSQGSGISCFHKKILDWRNQNQVMLAYLRV
jgi:hypothetical protein